MASKFFSLSNALALAGHPIAQQGKQGGPDTVRSVGIIYDEHRQLFQAVFFCEKPDVSRLAQDVERAGFLLHTIFELQPISDPDPGDYPVMRELRTSAAQKARTDKARPAARKPRQDARAKAEEAVELLRQLLVL